MSININSGFALGAATPIDDRIVLTKEQMLNIDENVFPDTYFCVCKDDGALYLFNKNNIYLDGLGKFRLYSGDAYFSNCPIGTVLSFAGSAAPRGYLLCDGSSYKIEDYTDLYAVIGNTYGGDTENFNVPDYRETVLVGIGENTTDTIANHDIYKLGEFKDDQLQTHTHTVSVPDAVYQYTPTFAGGPGPNSKTTAGTSNNSGRKGTTTHGKQKGITYIIKAFYTNEGMDSGVSDDVIEYVESKIDDSSTSETSTWSSNKIASEIEETIDFTTPIFTFEGSENYTDTYTYTTVQKTMLVCSISGVSSASDTDTDKNAYCRIVVNNLVLCSAIVQGDMTAGLGNSCILPKGTQITMSLRSRRNQRAQIFAYAIN